MFVCWYIESGLAKAEICYEYRFNISKGYVSKRNFPVRPEFRPESDFVVIELILIIHIDKHIIYVEPTRSRLLMVRFHAYIG